MCAWSHFVLRRLIPALALSSVLLASACTDEAPDEVGQQTEASTEGFHRHLVFFDEALTDADAMTVAEIQAFLEATPYGNRSVLADHESHGLSAAQAIYDAAHHNDINPLVILTRTQLEQSLVAKTSASSRALDWAMGCGCPDNRDCFEGYRGFDVQVECMAEKTRSYLDDQADGGTTVAGWKVGKRMRTLDGHDIWPRNAATAALYTYTPWMSSAKMHLGIFQRFAEHTGYQAPAPGACPVATYPSGASIQLRPDARLADAFDAQRSCFLDLQQLYDPIEHRVFEPTVALAANFRLAEFTAEADDDLALVDPVLVDVLQRMRSALGRGISVRAAYRHPLVDDDACIGSDDVTCSGELPRGLGAVVSSSAGDAALLEAAYAAGAATCERASEGIYVGVAEPGWGCTGE